MDGWMNAKVDKQINEEQMDKYMDGSVALSVKGMSGWVDNG